MLYFCQDRKGARESMSKKSAKTGRYVIDLQKWRSAAALFACSVTLVFSIIAIFQSTVTYIYRGWGLDVMFRYFTRLSNILTALASSFIIPYAVNGIKCKRFVYPKWLSILHYMGTICTTLTMFFSLAVILPFDRELALGGSNFYLHVICPIAVLISFLLVESGYIYTMRDNLYCLAPFLLYAVVYIVMVVFVGESNGGWADMYKVATYVPVYVSFPVMLALAFAIAFGIRKLSNLLTVRRQNRMMFSWDKDPDPVRIKIELYGLGRYYGLHDDKNDLSIPYDILEALASRYDLPCVDLMNAYTRGLYHGMCEADSKKKRQAPR